MNRVPRGPNTTLLNEYGATDNERGCSWEYLPGKPTVCYVAGYLKRPKRPKLSWLEASPCQPSLLWKTPAEKDQLADVLLVDLEGRGISHGIKHGYSDLVYGMLLGLE
ncbi:hypothetical protein E4U21_001751 [Claviceps maximensis]|nr:hypothetical protein E4U21_001751 [Claviceps maximensis]